MKTRNGFVSNSSSSSFIVSTKDFDSPLDVAMYMITIRRDKRLEENGQWSAASAAYNEELIAEIDEIKRSAINYRRLPVHFNSCNYDTYIAAFRDGFHVSTCNNEPWDNFGSYYDDYFDSENDPVRINENFIDLDEEVRKKHGEIIKRCPSCRLMLSDGYCDRCGKRYDDEELMKMEIDNLHRKEISGDPNSEL